MKDAKMIARTAKPNEGYQDEARPRRPRRSAIIRDYKERVQLHTEKIVKGFNERALQLKNRFAKFPASTPKVPLRVHTPPPCISPIELEPRLPLLADSLPVERRINRSSKPTVDQEDQEKENVGSLPRLARSRSPLFIHLDPIELEPLPVERRINRSLKPTVDQEDQEKENVGSLPRLARSRSPLFIHLDPTNNNAKQDRPQDHVLTLSSEIFNEQRPPFSTTIETRQSLKSISSPLQSGKKQRSTKRSTANSRAKSVGDEPHDEPIATRTRASPSRLGEQQTRKLRCSSARSRAKSAGEHPPDDDDGILQPIVTRSRATPHKKRSTTLRTRSSSTKSREKSADEYSQQHDGIAQPTATRSRATPQKKRSSAKSTTDDQAAEYGQHNDLGAVQHQASKLSQLTLNSRAQQKEENVDQIPDSSPSLLCASRLRQRTSKSRAEQKEESVDQSKFRQRTPKSRVEQKKENVEHSPPSKLVKEHVEPLLLSSNLSKRQRTPSSTNINQPKSTRSNRLRQWLSEIPEGQLPNDLSHRSNPQSNVSPRTKAKQRLNWSSSDNDENDEPLSRHPLNGSKNDTSKEIENFEPPAILGKHPTSNGNNNDTSKRSRINLKDLEPSEAKKSSGNIEANKVSKSPSRIPRPVGLAPKSPGVASQNEARTRCSLKLFAQKCAEINSGLTPNGLRPLETPHRPVTKQPATLEVRCKTTEVACAAIKRTVSIGTNTSNEIIVVGKKAPQSSEVTQSIGASHEVAEKNEDIVSRKTHENQGTNKSKNQEVVLNEDYVNEASINAVYESEAVCASETSKNEASINIEASNKDDLIEASLIESSNKDVSKSDEFVRVSENEASKNSIKSASTVQEVSEIEIPENEVFHEGLSKTTENNASKNQVNKSKAVSNHETEAPKKHQFQSSKHEVLQNEASLHELPRDEASKHETSIGDACQSGGSEHESSNTEVPQKETSKHESARNEISKIEAPCQSRNSKHESSNVGLLQNEASIHELLTNEVSKHETSKNGSSKLTQSAQQDAAPRNEASAHELLQDGAAMSKQEGVFHKTAEEHTVIATQRRSRANESRRSQRRGSLHKRSFMRRENKRVPRVINRIVVNNYYSNQPSTSNQASLSYDQNITSNNHEHQPNVATVPLINNINTTLKTVIGSTNVEGLQPINEEPVLRRTRALRIQLEPTLEEEECSDTQQDELCLEKQVLHLENQKELCLENQQELCLEQQEKLQLKDQQVLHLENQNELSLENQQELCLEQQENLQLKDQQEMQQAEECSVVGAGYKLNEDSAVSDSCGEASCNQDASCESVALEQAPSRGKRIRQHRKEPVKILSDILVKPQAVALVDNLKNLEGVCNTDEPENLNLRRSPRKKSCLHKSPSDEVYVNGDKKEDSTNKAISRNVNESQLKEPNHTKENGQSSCNRLSKASNSFTDSSNAIIDELRKSKEINEPKGRRIETIVNKLTTLREVDDSWHSHTSQHEGSVQERKQRKVRAASPKKNPQSVAMEDPCIVERVASPAKQEKKSRGRPHKGVLKLSKAISKDKKPSAKKEEEMVDRNEFKRLVNYFLQGSHQVTSGFTKSGRAIKSTSILGNTINSTYGSSRNQTILKLGDSKVEKREKRKEAASRSNKNAKKSKEASVPQETIEENPEETLGARPKNQQLELKDTNIPEKNAKSPKPTRKNNSLKDAIKTSKENVIKKPRGRPRKIIKARELQEVNNGENIAETEILQEASTNEGEDVAQANVMQVINGDYASENSERNVPPLKKPRGRPRLRPKEEEAKLKVPETKSKINKPIITKPSENIKATKSQEVEGENVLEVTVKKRRGRPRKQKVTTEEIATFKVPTQRAPKKAQASKRVEISLDSGNGSLRSNSDAVTGRVEAQGEEAKQEGRFLDLGAEETYIKKDNLRRKQKNSFKFTTKKGKTDSTEWYSTDKEFISADNITFGNTFRHEDVVHNGTMEIPLGTTKGFSIAKDNHISYGILSGKAEVIINSIRMELEAKRRFVVPEGAEYKVTNIGEESLILHYMIIK